MLNKLPQGNVGIKDPTLLNPNLRYTVDHLNILYSGNSCEHAKLEENNYVH
jgi:hypothetical protein